MELDGRRQRNALTAVERSLEALAAGSSDRAMRNAAKAAELDQIGVFRELPAAVEVAASDGEVAGSVSPESWERIREVLPPGPLLALLDSLCK